MGEFHYKSRSSSRTRSGSRERGDRERVGLKRGPKQRARETDSGHIARALKEAFHSTTKAVVQMQEALLKIKNLERSDSAVVNVAQRLKGHSRMIKTLDERIHSLERKTRALPAAVGTGAGAAATAKAKTPHSGRKTHSARGGPEHRQRVAAAAPSASSGCPLGRLPSTFHGGGSTPVYLCSANDSAYSRLQPLQAVPSQSLSPSSSHTHSHSQSLSLSHSQSPNAYATHKLNSVASVPSLKRTDSDDSKRICLGRRLLRAAHEGRTLDVQRLLDSGADANYAGTGRWTPLHRAAARAHAGVVALLICRGCQVDKQDCYGFSALHMAAYNDPSGRCVAYLLDGGADLRLTDRSGRTALHSAAEGGNGSAVLALVAAGADKGARDGRGRTPFDVARAEGLRRLLYPDCWGLEERG